MNAVQVLTAAVLALTAATGPVAAVADNTAGAKVYKKCQVCHLADQEKNKVGPHLVGLFGRTAGKLEGFKFSRAMTDSGIVWDEETLDAYLEAPRKNIPGNRMAFAGVKNGEERAALIDYLRTATLPKVN